MQSTISGYALKRRVLRRMRSIGLDTSAAAAIRFPERPSSKILGTSIKVEKSRKIGWLTKVIYFAPHTESLAYGGRNLCPAATAGCSRACLGDKGRLSMSIGRNAKAWKTLTFLYARAEFRAMLVRAIGNHNAHARRLGLRAGIRPNGSTDIIWERVMPEVFELFPDTDFYDYTKIHQRLFTQLPANYHLTFSFSGANWPECLEWLGHGRNVAMVFTPHLPETYRGYRVINGDEHDARPTDDKGVIVGLTPKGHARDDSGFFIHL